MTTRINIFNEGPGDVLVTEKTPGIADLATILSPAQGLEKHVWIGGTKFVVEEKEPE